MPIASWTGELADPNSGDEQRWFRGLQSYTLRWVDRHCGEAVEYAEIVTGQATAVPSRNSN